MASDGSEGDRSNTLRAILPGRVHRLRKPAPVIAMPTMTAVEEPTTRPTRYLDVPALLKRWPLSKSTVYDLVATPEWCSQVHTLRIGSRVLFLESDIEAIEASWLVTPEMAEAAQAEKAARREARRAEHEAPCEDANQAPPSASEPTALPAYPARKRTRYTKAVA